MPNLCKGCRWAKDKFGESCYCVYYGYIVHRGKENCWGNEITLEEQRSAENEQADNHRKSDQGS